MCFSICISFGFKNEVSRQVFGFSGHLRIGNYSSFSSDTAKPISSQSIHWNDFENIARFHPQPVATQLGLVKTDLYNHGILFKGVDRNFDFSFFNACLIAGTLPRFSDSSISNDVLIANNLSKKLHLKLGDKLRTYFIHNADVRARAFTICGIFESGFSNFDEKMIIGDLQHLQRINRWDTCDASYFEIILPDAENKNLIGLADKFNQLLPFDCVAVPISDDFPEIFNWLELMDMNVIVILVIMALVVAISLISVFVVMVIEKTNEIGIFKTMGMNLSDLRKIFILKVMYIAGKGLLIGNGIGLTLCCIQKYFPLFKLNPETYYIKHVPIHFEWSWLILCNVATLVIVFSAVLLPSIAIGKIKEAEAVKFS